MLSKEFKWETEMMMVLYSLAQGCFVLLLVVCLLACSLACVCCCVVHECDSVGLMSGASAGGQQGEGMKRSTK